MTRNVVAVGAGTPVHTAARLMLEHRVGGLPVVESSDRLVGIVTEADLIVRLQPRRQRGWTDALAGDRRAREYRRAVGTTVGEVMTRPVITVAPQRPLEEAAALLDQHRVSRLPVARSGRLAGIISRSDLLRVVAATPPPGPIRSDTELVAEMRSRLARERWACSGRLFIFAEDGVLHLSGLVENEAHRSALETMARSIGGGRGVQSHLVDCSALPARII